MRKNYLFLIVFLITVNAGATNYYLAASGNNGNSGTASGSPWQTIAKLNTVTYASGDTVFFNRSDVFPGDIIVNQGGTSSSPVVFTSYGIGDTPVIMGSEDITGWTASGNYYTVPYTGSVNNFFVNGKEQTLARYPNEQVYLTLDSAQAGYLRDASLASLNSNLIAGSNICVHSSQWSWEKTSVFSFLGDKITYGSTLLRPNNNYGYFLYDNITHLDTANEWKYDGTAHIMYYYPPSGVDPNTKTCSVSVYQNGIELGPNVSYISILNIGFENQSNAGVQIGYSSSRYIIIDGCYFSGQYNHGVNAKGKYAHISNSYFTNIDGIAVFVNGGGIGSTVDHNYFRNNGLTRVNGLGGQINGTALMCATDSNYFHHNNIDSSGYCGISADGKANLVERNIVDHSMLIENDGGGIKGWGIITTQSVYRNNFISNGDGNTEGTYQASFITPAIYFDFNVNNCTISDNTVYNHAKKGIFQNSANHDNTIQGNVIYGGSYLLDLNGTNLAPSAVPISGMIIKHNSFFSKDNNSVIIRQVDYTSGFNTGTLDSNYYFQPYNLNRYALRMNGTTPTYYTFSSWQGTGNDAHTVNSFVDWTYPTSYDTLIMNQTDNAVSVNLGSNKFLDLDSNDVCGSIILQPYTSRILINTNVSCATGIAENNNISSIEVYPNPCKDEIRIRASTNLPNSTFQLMDIYGKIVLTGRIDPNKEHISTKNLSPGLYFVMLKNDRIYGSKIIKE